jgi:hypothetical protein
MSKGVCYHANEEKAIRWCKAASTELVSATKIPWLGIECVRFTGRPPCSSASHV